MTSNRDTTTGDHSRLRRKQGVLVIDTGAASKFDINAFISEMREEWIQGQIALMAVLKPLN
jgi:hypothetical protein